MSSRESLHTATQLLNRLGEGDARAAEELAPLVYGELRKLADHALLNDPARYTLPPTALVNEAWLHFAWAGARFAVRGIFSDLKRHDLGPNFHEEQFDGSIVREFVTEPLWGVASTGPYGHDGRSPTLEAVILRHGGEAQRSRDLFGRLPEPERKRVLALFLFEAEVLGNLRHPAIAQIYEAGTHEEGGQSFTYFAMELVAGARDLLSYARTEQLALEARLELFLHVCDAVHHGHQKGVIHRDLKAGNILVDVEGRVKVIDFGVARAMQAEARLTAQTQAGQLVGTLATMGPEQLAGDPGQVDARSDVYSLGVVLYELVTGKPPYELEGLPLEEALRCIREVDPAARAREGSRAPLSLGFRARGGPAAVLRAPTRGRRAAEQLVPGAQVRPAAQAGHGRLGGDPRHARSGHREHVLAGGARARRTTRGGDADRGGASRRRLPRRAPALGGSRAGAGQGGHRARASPCAVPFAVTSTRTRS